MSFPGIATKPTGQFTDMDIIEFLKTIYLGDRACKSILIDGCNAEIKVQVTCISRVRSANWDYYTAEDLVDGFLVFEGVTRLTFEPPGFIPNDFIDVVRVEKPHGDQTKYLVILSVGSADKDGNNTNVEMRIYADSMALEDVHAPGRRITT
jgi:hypothetical protein